MKVAVILLAITVVSLVLAQSKKPTITSAKHFDKPLRDLKYINHKVIVALLHDDKKLQRSVDGGITWTTVALTSSISDNAVSDLHVNGDTVVVHGTKSTNWWSIDGGATFTEDKSTTRMSHLMFHPREQGSLLGYAYDNHASYVTTDYGKSYQRSYEWSLEPSSWGDAGIEHVPKHRIYGVARLNSGADYTLDYTDDKGSNYVTLQKNSFTAVYMDHQIFSLAYSDRWRDIYLRVSPDIGKDVKNFYRAEFPWGEELEEKNLYAILDDSTGAVFMAINHQDNKSPWGHLYVSDPLGVQYVMSLPYVVHANTEFDFMKVLGMKGVYVANQLVNYNAPAGSPEEVETMITFNNGGSWEQLNAPLKDMYGASYPGCGNGQCKLHLHGWKTIANHAEVIFGPFYSAESALGLIIGNGNVGQYLSSDPSKVGTFISDDGGISFREIGKGPTIYEIADHGGVVVFAEVNKVVNQVCYTLDFGLSRPTCVPLPSSVAVWNIISETYLNGTSFLILDHNYTTVMQIEFKTAFDRECTINDYKEWFPSTPASRGQDDLICQMGVQTKYLRRDPSIKCHSMSGYLEGKIRDITPCKCTDNDWECDYGYTNPNPESGFVCTRDNSIKLNDPPLWCKPGRRYNVTKGYRLEAGNGCRGGVDHHPEEKDCPDTPVEDADEYVNPNGASHKAGWIAVGIMVPIVLLIVAGAFIALNNEKLREKLPYFGTLFSTNVARDGYSRPGGGAPALFDDEEYIIGPLDDRHDDDEPDGLKNVDLHSPSASPQELDEFDPRK